MERNSLSVIQLNNYIKGVFDDELILKDITVYGEVFECSLSSTNTLFITLKENDTILHCVRFGGGERPEIGDSVALRGSVEFYPKGNRVSFVFTEIAYFGEGKLRKEFIALREALLKEGLFDNQLKLPRFIQKVAIITSETGAVIHDFLSIIQKDNSYIDVVLYPVRVQGDGADLDICQAIEKANRLCSGQVIIIARGGGSSVELAPFNTEKVARAVATSKIPIISAVGHETDYTLCDFCSSFRAGTPSIAGEKICRINENFIAEFYLLLDRLNKAINKLSSRTTLSVCQKANRLTDLANNILSQNLSSVYKSVDKMQRAIFEKRIKSQYATIDSYKKLLLSANSLLSSKENLLKEKVACLNASNPLKIISGGYAKVYKGGEVVSKAKSLNVGDNVDVVLSDGIVSAEVLSVKTTGENL